MSEHLGQPDPWASMSPVEIAHRAGQGNWGAFKASGMSLEYVLHRAATWSSRLHGIEKPWLCWNVDHHWCFVQQRLVKEVGWTPVVGYDPRVGPPSFAVEGAIVIDFNDGIGLPVLYPHFAIEFAFLFAPRLAFWHSDLLLSRATMAKLARSFEAMPDGRTIVTANETGWIDRLRGRHQRHWELVGCTTRRASRDQFEKGCGWWMEFWEHPNCPDDAARRERKAWYWDHGAGVYYWDKRLRGDVSVLRDKSINAGHFTKIGRKDYKRSVIVGGSDAQRSMQQELNDNFDLVAACRTMGIADITATS